MKHHFDVNFATKYGMAEAVLAENIFFWARKNAANGLHFHDGMYWTYNSGRAFSLLFPYISARTIDRALTHLVDEGILLKGNYNEDKMNRTLWYALTKKGEEELAETVEFADSANVADCIGQNGECIRQNGECNNINNTDIKHTDTKPKRTKEGTNQSYESVIESSDVDESVKPVIWDFIKMRKLIKSPMTDRALLLMINKLKKMDSSSDVQIAILNQSIISGWKDIYELKQSYKEQELKPTDPKYWEKKMDEWGIGNE